MSEITSTVGSVNTFVVQQIEVSNELLDNAKLSGYSATLFCVIEMVCPITGELFMEVEISTTAYHSDVDEVVRRLINNLFLGKFSSTSRMFGADIECTPDYNSIHGLRVEIGEPFEQLFKDLFDVFKWKQQFQIAY